MTLSEIEDIDRDREPPDEGPMVELLWSDPIAVRGRQPSKRGVGVMFGPDVTEDFLKTNGLKMVVRSHEMQEEGYQKEHGGKLVHYSNKSYKGNLNIFFWFNCRL